VGGGAGAARPRATGARAAVAVAATSRLDVVEAAEVEEVERAEAEVLAGAAAAATAAVALVCSKARHPARSERRSAMERAPHALVPPCGAIDPIVRRPACTPSQPAERGHSAGRANAGRAPLFPHVSPTPRSTAGGNNELPRHPLAHLPGFRENPPVPGGGHDPTFSDHPLEAAARECLASLGAYPLPSGLADLAARGTPHPMQPRSEIVLTERTCGTDEDGQCARYVKASLRQGDAPEAAAASCATARRSSNLACHMWRPSPPGEYDRIQIQFPRSSVRCGWPVRLGHRARAREPSLPDPDSYLSPCYPHPNLSPFPSLPSRLAACISRPTAKKRGNASTS